MLGLHKDAAFPWYLLYCFLNFQALQRASSVPALLGIGIGIAARHSAPCCRGAVGALRSCLERRWSTRKFTQAGREMSSPFARLIEIHLPVAKSLFPQQFHLFVSLRVQGFG